MLRALVRITLLAASVIPFYLGIYRAKNSSLIVLVVAYFFRLVILYSRVLSIRNFLTLILI